MTADRSGRLTATLLAWALPALAAGASGWEARFGGDPGSAGYQGPAADEFADDDD